MTSFHSVRTPLNMPSSACIAASTPTRAELGDRAVLRVLVAPAARAIGVGRVVQAVARLGEQVRLVFGGTPSAPVELPR